jgi:hypothetical protein
VKLPLRQPQSGYWASCSSMGSLISEIGAKALSQSGDQHSRLPGQLSCLVQLAEKLQCPFCEREHSKAQTCHNLRDPGTIAQRLANLLVLLIKKVDR